VAKSSGVGWLVVLGLVALGFAGSGGGFDGDTDAEPAGADDDFSFEPEPGAPSGSGDSDSGSDCDDVVVMQVSSGAVAVPGESGVFQEETVQCEMVQGDDGEAVAVLQDALVRCNGQAIAVDGEYGPSTAQAVADVQQRSGLSADGTFDDATRRAMAWPASSSSGITCSDTG
jgi:hypothetical protein